MSKVAARRVAFVVVTLVSTSAGALQNPDDEEIVVKPDVRPPAAPSAAPAPPAPPPPQAAPLPPSQPAPPEGFRLTGYLQSQFETHQDSDDQLRQGGAVLNQDRFLVRRARLRVDGEWKHAAAIVELDANTVRGPAIGLRKAEGTLKWRSADENVFASATLGLFDTPFGYELVESPRARFFLERSLASRSMFPGEPDLGVRVSGGLGFLRLTAGLVNGQPLDERTPFPGQDPNAAKDFVFRVGVETKPRPALEVSGGVSALRGRGFHPGTDATKGTIEWRDLNEDGIVQPSELVAIPGTAATPSANFERWLVGADLQLRYRSPLGSTLAYAEVQVGNNMDRGLFPSDPIALGIDTRQLGWYAGVVQDLGEHVVVGLRFDYYDPNADVFDRRGGKLIPFSQRVLTLSPLVGFVLRGRARLLGQYDLVDNSLARDDRGVPTRLKNNAFTVRLQVEL